MRLNNLNLTTLETRRIRGDLIEVYRIVNGIEGIDWKLLFSKAPYDGTRGHTMKLENNVMNMVIRKYFFSLKIHLNNIMRGVTQAISFLPLPHSPAELKSGIQ